jgi:hypothetical protein
MDLLDGGRLMVPDWGHYDHIKGTWTVENQGVPPDIEVDILLWYTQRREPYERSQIP